MKEQQQWDIVIAHLMVICDELVFVRALMEVAIELEIFCNYAVRTFAKWRRGLSAA
jgi:hypothetical protein